MAKNGEEARLETPKQWHGWSKILNTARKYTTKMENYDIEVQIYAQTRSGRGHNWLILGFHHWCDQNLKS